MSYVCKLETCERETELWQPRCPNCGALRTLIPRAALARRKRAKVETKAKVEIKLPRQGSLDIYPDENLNRTKTGWDQIDDLLGGGLPDGKVILLTGPPGIGKSTLLIQLASLLQPSEYYASEEDARSVATRARRLSLPSLSQIFCCSTQSVVRALNELRKRRKRKLVIIDSLQGFRFITPEQEDSVEGPLFTQKKTHQDVLNIAHEFIRVARTVGVSIILVSHINKEGEAAGFKEIEHMVDGFAEFDGDGKDYWRTLAFNKSRFGATAGVMAKFWMTKRGLVDEPEDPVQGMQDFVARGWIDPPKQRVVQDTVTLAKEIAQLEKEGVVAPGQSNIIRAAEKEIGKSRKKRVG